MRSVATVVLSVFATIHGAVCAQPDLAGTRVSYIGVGTLNCGSFVQSKEDGNQEQLDLFVQWTWGFLSAYMFRAQFVPRWNGPARTGNLGTLPDRATVLLYLEKYCRDHPLDQVIDAAVGLLRESGGNVIWRR